MFPLFQLMQISPDCHDFSNLTGDSSFSQSLPLLSQAVLALAGEDQCKNADYLSLLHIMLLKVLGFEDIQRQRFHNFSGHLFHCFTALSQKKKILNILFFCKWRLKDKTKLSFTYSVSPWMCFIYKEKDFHGRTLCQPVLRTSLLYI